MDFIHDEKVINIGSQKLKDNIYQSFFV